MGHVYSSFIRAAAIADVASASLIESVGGGRLCLRASDDPALDCDWSVGEPARSDSGAVHRDLEHIRPSVVSGRVKILPLGTHARQVQIGDDQSFLTDQGFGDPGPVRARDR